MAKITYANKVTLNPQPSVADENKVTDDDMNEIKSVVNGLIVNSYTADDENTYSCDYMNELNTYKTTEQRIGTWTDGKPIYRKVVTGTLPTENYSTFITIDNLDTPISESILITMADNSKLRLPFVQLVNNIYCDYYISGNTYNVHFTVNSYKSRPFIAILEYTKTTD